mmetsp:Transcript_11171/g.31680  ORF Transcript_11171/g.31680 Transcript_11171/m.31680 type:complete len:172 (+) Transcript_11171:1-516(+)
MAAGAAGSSLPPHETGELPAGPAQTDGGQEDGQTQREYVEYFDQEPDSGDDEEGGEGKTSAGDDGAQRGDFSRVKDPDLVRKGRVIRQVARIGNRIIRPGMSVLVNSSKSEPSQPFPALVNELFEEQGKKKIHVTWLFRRSELSGVERTGPGRKAEDRGKTGGHSTGGRVT